MKKHILAIILCVLCASFVLVLASCGGDTNTDSNDCSVAHNFGDWTTETYASCTSPGLKVRVCKTCSFEEEEPIPSGHKFGEWEVVKELTCEQDGLDQRICSVCDWIDEDETKAEGHKWSEWDTTVEGNCTDDGEVTRECSACGKTETEAVPGDGHNFSEWGFDLVGAPFVQEATCEGKGYIGRECIDCGEQEFQETDALGHSWGAWNVVGSCADGATKTRECSVCGEDDEEITNPGEHANIVYEGAKAPTLGEDGSTGTKKCVACGEILEGAKIIRITNLALGGTVEGNSAFWASGSATYWKRLVDGNRESGVCSDPKIPNVVETITFNKTGKVEQVILVVNGKGSTVAESFDSVTNNEYTISFTLFDKDGKTVYVSDSFSTLDKEEIVVDIDIEAEVAGIEIKRSTLYKTDKNLWEVYAYATEYLSACDANGHTWGEETRVEPSCSQEGLTDGYVSKTCSACGEVDKQVIVATHAWTEWDVTNFSCTEGGTMTRSCTSCGKVESQTSEGGEHGDVELKGVKEPTLEEDGYTGDKVCLVCGQTTETGTAIPKLVNVALNATASTSSKNWLIVGQGEESWYPSRVPSINDGDLSNGSTAGDYNSASVDFILTWDEAVQINKIIYVCNGSGNLGYQKGDLKNTNFAVVYTITAYDANGNVIKTATGNTKDQTQIEVEISEGSAAVKKVVVNIANAYGSDGGVFEIIAVAPGQN